MNKGQRVAMLDKYRPATLLLISILFFCINGISQVYIPSKHIPVNDGIFPGQQAPLNGQTMYFDTTLFIYRPFQNTAEALTYLTSTPSRFGNAIIVIDSGGALQPGGSFLGGANTFWMFRNGTANVNLVKMSLFGESGGACVGCLLAANNLSDLGNLTTALTNIGLNNVNNTSDATKNAASVTLTNKTISGLFNTFSNIPNSALQNAAIGLSITNNSAPDIAVTTTPAQLGASLIFNIPTASGSQRGALSSTDWTTFNGKQSAITLTTAGTSGPATFAGNVLNVPQYTSGTGCLNCSADSIKKLPVDTTSDRNAYVLTFDSTNHKWYLSPNGAGSGITQLTGDGTAGPGSGSQALTLATVNANVGTFGNASTVSQFTVNAKGLITAAAGVSIQIAELQVTGLTSDLAGKLSTTLNSGNVFVGNGSNVATGVAMSGDVHISNTGATTIQPNAVTLGDMATNTANSLLGYNNSGAAANVTTDATLSLASNVLGIALGHANTWTATQTFNGMVIAGGVAFSANNTWSIGTSSVAAAHIWSRFLQSDASLTLGSTSGSPVTIEVGSTPGVTLLSTGQAQFNNYTGSGFTGTANDSILTINPANGNIGWRSGQPFFIAAVNGLQALGVNNPSDSIGLGNGVALYQNVNISGSNARSFILDSMQAGSGRGFKVNFGSDAGWDMIVKDSATGYWTRVAKGTPGQSFQMLLSGGVGWANQAGGGVNTDVLTTITSGSSSTVPNGTNIIQFNPTSVIASYTLTLPTTWHNSNDLLIVFTANGTLTNGATMVTTLTIVNGSGHTLSQIVAPTTGQAGESIRYHLVGGNVEQRIN